MNWNLEGLIVRGRYLGQHPVQGHVVLSRTKYGSGIDHHVVLDHPLDLFGSCRDRVVLAHHHVDQVLQNHSKEWVRHG